MGHGCQYAQRKWRLNAFKARWEPFKTMSPNIGKFRPWKPLSGSSLMEAARNIKVSGELARKGSKEVFSNRKTNIKSIQPKTVEAGSHLPCRKPNLCKEPLSAPHSVPRSPHSAFRLPSERPNGHRLLSDLPNEFSRRPFDHLSFPLPSRLFTPADTISFSLAL